VSTIFLFLRRNLKRNERIYKQLRGVRTRVRCWRHGLSHVHSTAYIAANSTLSRDIEIGPYAYVGPEAMICPRVRIGAYSMIGPRVTIVGKDHIFDRAGVPTIFSGRPALSPTVIDADVWIGACSTLIAGVHIGRGSVVAAGAVVTRDVPPFCIVAGVPARVLRKRFGRQEDEQKHSHMLDEPLATGKFCPDL
jgi:acetyltransferase-like isoleucine patch superfamily enzyme